MSNAIEPDLVLGYRALPFEERHFHTEGLAENLGYKVQSRYVKLEKLLDAQAEATAMRELIERLEQSSNDTRFPASERITTVRGLLQRFREDGGNYGFGKTGIEEKLNVIRSLGWAVAVHNDYRMNGESFTFWGFTRGNEFVKGEGRTDAEAIDAAFPPKSDA